MRDRRVREESLQVALGKRREVPPRERDAGEDGDRERPDVALLRERGHEQASATTIAAVFVAADMNAVTDVGEPW